jgi:2-polyprenyl-3-methyl-5-hydroxy-6-metoxy-1,4-benzoquinol methylase
MYLTEVEALLRRDGARLVLDAGCGNGNFTASLARAGFQMYGMDLSEGGIARAKAAYSGIRFCKASIYDPYLPTFEIKDPFDAIVSIEVIEHLHSPRTFMKRAYEALKPGGLIIITTPYWGYLKNLLLAFTNRIDRALTVLWEGGHIKHWSYATLLRLGTEHGFEFESFHGTKGRPPFLWKGMIMVFRKPDHDRKNP